MLNDVAFEVGLNLAEYFGEKDLGLRAKPGSVLARLVTANVPVTEAGKSLSDLKGIGRDPGYVRQMASYTDDNGVNHHDTVMKDALHLITEVLRGQRDLAFGSAAPMIREIRKEYTDGLARSISSLPPLVQIIPNTYHEIWSNASLRTMVEQLTNSSYRRHMQRAVFPDEPVDSLVRCLKHNVPSISESVSNWATNMQPEKVLSAYQKIFRPVDGIKLGDSTNIQHQTQAGLDRNDMLIGFFIATNLADEVTAKSSMTLDQIRSECHKIKASLGTALAAEISKRDTASNSKYMVYNTAKNKAIGGLVPGDVTHIAYVNNDVYLNYLNNGGSPEALMGAIASGGNYRFDYLVKNKPVMEEAYRVAVARRDQLTANNMAAIRKDVLSTAISRMVAREDFGTTFNSGAELSTVRENITSFFKEIGNITKLDDRDLITKCVCRTFFKDTNVEYILETMQEVSEEFGLDDPKEANLIANTYMLADWLSTQVEIVTD